MQFHGIEMVGPLTVEKYSGVLPDNSTGIWKARIIYRLDDDIIYFGTGTSWQNIGTGTDGIASIDFSAILGNPYSNTNLSQALNLKANSSHTHSESDISNLSTDLSNKSDVGHSHSESDISNLTSDLAGKASVNHTHSESQIVNLTSDLANKAPISHTHNESDINGLSAELNNKSNINHEHNIATTLSPGFLPVLENDALKFLDSTGNWSEVQANTAYIADSNYWESPTPTNIKDAIDRLAKFLYAHASNIKISV